METAAWLQAFNASPAKCEEFFAQAEQTNLVLLTRDLCTLSSPTNATCNHHAKFLALKFLQGVISRHWRVANNRRLSTAVVSPIPDADKQQIVLHLLRDVDLEPMANLASKRNQIIAEIARFESFRWNYIFSVLTTEDASIAVMMRKLCCLHVVLKDLSGLRIGSHLLEFTQASKTLFAVLSPKLKLLAVKYDEDKTNESVAEMFCMVIKSMNHLLRGSTEIDIALVSVQFQLCYKVVTTSPTAATSTAWQTRLDKHLRKLALIALKVHPVWFQQQQSLFASFVTCATKLLTSKPNTGNDGNKLFAFQFWILLVSKPPRRQEAPALLPNIDQVKLVMQSAIYHLQLLPQDVEEWRDKGGEEYCFNEAEALFETKASADQTLRDAAKRFLQASVEHMEQKKDMSLFSTLLASQNPQSELEWEAFWCFAKLHLTALQAQGNALMPKLMSCIKPSARCEQAILTRRALCVLQDCHPTEECYPLLAGLLNRAETEDVGVLMQVVEVYIAIISQQTTFSLERFAKHFAIPKIAVLWRRVERVESKIRIIDLFSCVVANSSAMDAANLAFVIDDFVPFAMLDNSIFLQQSAAAARRTKDPLICNAVLDLVHDCVTYLGFCQLLLRSQKICLDLIQHCIDMNDLRLLDWPKVLLACLDTGRSGEGRALFLPFIRPPVLASISDVAIRCRMLECIALLFPGASNTTDYSVIVRTLYDLLAEASSPAAAKSSGDRKGLLPRTAQEVPFIPYNVCHCLGVLVQANNMVPVQFWFGVLNSPFPAAEDARDLVELVTLKSQILVHKLAFFNSLELAQQFAKLCVKHFDSVGYAPNEAAWRSRLWTYALFFIVHQCITTGDANLKRDVEYFLPSLVECCAKLVTQRNYKPIDKESVATRQEQRKKMRSSAPVVLVLTAQEERIEALHSKFNTLDFLKMFTECWTSLTEKLGNETPMKDMRNIQVLLTME